MAVELVTGYSGTEHVSSSDDGARQAGTVGTGMYVLETVEDPLAATLENANTVTVGPGDALINGRHVRLTGSTTYAVPVGTQAMQTSSLLVLRYSVSDDGTEKVEAVTLTGEPAASDPQDPALATGSILDGDSPVDMPLYRVVTTGIESAQPVRLFETVPPISGLPGVGDNVLDVAHGGTGMTSEPSLLVNLGSTSPAPSFQESPRPGVTGTLPVARGGTGATNAAGARSNIGAAGIGIDTTSGSIWSDDTYDQLVCVQSVGAAGNHSLLGYGDRLAMYDMAASNTNWTIYPKKLLWSGSWSRGEVTIPRINRYRVLAASVANSDHKLVGVNTGNGTISLFANDCWGDDSANHMAASACRLTRTGSSETLTYSVGGRVNLGNNYSYGYGVINSVWGVA